MPKADDRNQKQHHEHQKQSKRVPRRRNTELENAAILAKRRTELLRERRILIVMTALCGVATALWVAALSTDFWIVVNSAHKNATDSSAVLKSHLGVWRGCITNRLKNDEPVGAQVLTRDECSYHNLDQDEELRALPTVAKTIVDYRRTIVALAGLSLLCHIMAVCFSIYTFRNSRYTFKRLAGCMHLMTAATVLVLIEVVSNGADYARGHLLSIFPPGSTWYHGFSYYLAWLVFAQFVISGLAFLIFSRKRKSLNIMDDDGNMLADDEHQFMGRM